MSTVPPDPVAEDSIRIERQLILHTPDFGHIHHHGHADARVAIDPDRSAGFQCALGRRLPEFRCDLLHGGMIDPPLQIRHLPVRQKPTPADRQRDRQGPNAGASLFSKKLHPGASLMRQADNRNTSLCVVGAAAKGQVS